MYSYNISTSIYIIVNLFISCIKSLDEEILLMIIYSLFCNMYILFVLICIIKLGRNNVVN